MDIYQSSDAHGLTDGVLFGPAVDHRVTIGHARMITLSFWRKFSVSVFYHKTGFLKLMCETKCFTDVWQQVWSKNCWTFVTPHCQFQF